MKFHYADRSLPLKAKNEVKNFIPSVFKKEGISLEKLDYIFCSDDYLLNINKTFLDHDFYTDIITFDLSENTKSTIGEVYISVDRVKDNAGSFQTTVQDEFLRVIFHGALHLCGYNDKTKKQADLMREKENFYIHRYHSRY